MSKCPPASIRRYEPNRLETPSDAMLCNKISRMSMLLQPVKHLLKRILLRRNDTLILVIT